MKRLITVFVAVIFTTYLYAQSPEKMSYQAVIRNSNSELVINTQVGIEINIRQGTPMGAVVYTETQAPTTNTNGLVSIEIGGSTGFINIDWSAGPYFIETRTDLSGGANYTITGTSQLLSVPYALYSKTADSISGGILEEDPNLPDGVQVGDMQTWNGSEWEILTPGGNGQILTICGGIPTWTNGGICPGQISMMNCSGAIQSGNLFEGVPANGVTIELPYAGGNGGSYSSQLINSTGVTGLTANLNAGILVNGNDTLTYEISGTPSGIGTASFLVTLGGISCDFLCMVDSQSTYPPNMIHCNGQPTVILGVTNPTTGKVWMDRNLGASQVATSSTDSLALGDLYQWGRFADGHQCRTSQTTSILSSTETPAHGNFILSTNSPYDWLSPQSVNLWQGLNGANNPCPDGYRLPTEAEFNAELLSWTTANAAGAFASPLKLTLTGRRNRINGVIEEEEYSRYWSSTIDGSSSRRLHFGSSFATVSLADRAFGFTVRCLKDTASLASLTTYVASNITASNAVSGGEIFSDGGSSIIQRGICWGTSSNPTIANQITNDGSGIGAYSSTVTGLSANTTYFVRAYAINDVGTAYGNEVSFTTYVYPTGTVFCNGSPTSIVEVVNPITGKIWMDRNLGAGQVATSSTDQLSYGDLYQWGRSSDGHQCRTSQTTTLLSSADTTGHGNFIVESVIPSDWRTPQNNNLWQGVNGINNPCPGLFRLPSEAEWNAERQSWGTYNAAGAYASPLKLPMSGYRFAGSGLILHMGSHGYYWSSTVVGTKSHVLDFYSSFSIMLSEIRADGFSVRCIKD